MNNANKPIMKAILTRLVSGLGILAILTSCDTGLEIPDPTLQMSIDLTLETPTRSPQPLNPWTHTAKVYMFMEEAAGSGQYAYWGEQAVTGGSLTVEGLQPQSNYRFVFLAVPRNQQPALPDYSASQPSYTEALVSYVSGSQPTNEVFRCILDFTATPDLNRYGVVLTRQNGALQIRLDNRDGKIKSVKLEVESASRMYFQDGTGGEVLTAGTQVLLMKSERPAKTDDYRISIYLLPTRDLTGQGQVTITYWNNVQAVYFLRSTSGRIPVYANQVTWLVLGDGPCGLGSE